MKYEERLAKELNNPDGYLSFEDTWPYSQLDGIASSMLQLNPSFESKMASLFIYHQVVEHILTLLYRYCDLIVRASLYPVILTEQKPRSGSLDFSKNLEALQSSIEFKNKSKLISSSKKLNYLRNKIGHKLVGNFHEIEDSNELDSVKPLFEEVFGYRTDALQWFREEIKRLKDTDEIKKILKKYK